MIKFLLNHFFLSLVWKSRKWSMIQNISYIGKKSWVVKINIMIMAKNKILLNWAFVEFNMKQGFRGEWTNLQLKVLLWKKIRTLMSPTEFLLHSWCDRLVPFHTNSGMWVWVGSGSLRCGIIAMLVSHNSVHSIVPLPSQIQVLLTYKIHSFPPNSPRCCNLSQHQLESLKS